MTSQFTLWVRLKMRTMVLLSITTLATVLVAQQPSTPAPGKDAVTENKWVLPEDAQLKAMFEGKIKTEWEALKNRDRKGYGALLADDYIGVEVDGRGERNKL